MNAPDNTWILPFAGGIVAVIVLVAFVGLILHWHHRRSSELMQAWAEQNGYQILSAEVRWLRRGPMFLTTSRGQTVYYVEVIGPEELPRTAWLRCGSFWWGIWARRVDVLWEDTGEHLVYEV